MSKASASKSVNAKSNAAAASEKKVRYNSENAFTLTGRLVKDVVTNDDKKYARFTIAHNFGKDMDALFTDCVAFAKNGKKDIDIPFDLLKKGAMVRVAGFLRPNNHEYKGKKYYATDFVALQCEPASVKEDEEDGDEE